MITGSRSKSGSALLIVLGFLSFMVVSAVSFAIYMRTERVASSGYHRSAAVRQLVKAGLANAIAEVDYAVADGPFPGMYGAHKDTPIGTNLGIDRWINRVFTPSNSVDSSETVPVLTLEGLSYLPPSLVNEVRAGARVTPTASWRSMSYDVGRFAYLAVNVSDFFDVNKVRFNTQRNSGPNGHISLAYLFQDDDATPTKLANGVNATQLKNLDKFMDTRGRASQYQKVPFVSLADLNVALYDYDPSGTTLGIESPFYNYLREGKWKGFYSQDSIPGRPTQADVDFQRARRMPFVTDSWQIPTNTLNDVIDLARDTHQPFPKSVFSNARNMNFYQLFNLMNSFGDAYKDRFKDDLSRMSVALLYDYLDDNSMPLSLAIPNVERVPMVACVNGGMIAQQLQMTLKGEQGDMVPYPRGGGGGQGDYYRQTTTYALQINGSALRIPVICLYPFKGQIKREGEQNNKDYKVQACLKIFFTSPGADAAGEWTCRASYETGISPTKAEWDGAGASFANNCVTLVSPKMPIQGFNSGKSILEEDDAIFQTFVTLPSLATLNAALKTNPLLEVDRILKMKQGVPEDAGEIDGYPKVSTFKLRPFSGATANGGGGQCVQPATIAPQTNVERDQATCWDKTLTPHIALWVRVVGQESGAEKTVDLAPAWTVDDVTLNGANIPMAYARNGIYIVQTSDGCAMAPFLGAVGTEIKFSPKEEMSVGFSNGEENAKPFEQSPANFVAIDPRYNHSPEDFIVRSDDVDKNAYLNLLDDILGQKGRDPDIFMFASDQQYLQSVGELAFLPYVSPLGIGEPQTPYAKCNNPMPLAASFADMDGGRCHKDSFWRTYPLYRQNGDGMSDDDYLFRYFGEKVDPADKIIVNDLNGFKITPYSDLQRIRLAATANTPHSFWASSTNTELVANKPPCFNGNEPKSIDECLKYCFNNWNGNVGPTLAWRDLTNITARVFDRMRADWNPDNAGSQSWEVSFANMDWYLDGDPEKIFGYSLTSDSDELHSVDRKMLYCFWHDSFANRQQLFLIFVRAESTPFGASKNMPSQHGGRAVALVWRDPEPSPGGTGGIEWFNTDKPRQENDGRLYGYRRGNTYKPHRTRLLFYHQFD